MPKISIITPCYNCENFIRQTIESVQTQSFTDWEWVIVDDGSHDRSALIIQDMVLKDKRLRLIQQTNQGVAKARNIGFSNSHPESDFLLFLDADDCLKPEMLEILAHYLEQYSEVGLVYCDRTYIDSNDIPLETPTFPRLVPSWLGFHTLPNHQTETPFASVFNLAPIIPSLALIRRSIYKFTSGWDETFGQLCEDTDVFLMIALLAKIHYLPKQLVLYRQHKHQSTANSNKFAVQERKLYYKWLHLKSLTDEQKAQVRKAWKFREGRVLPHSGALAGTRHLKRGEIKQALRFYLGAVRRYTLSFLPDRLFKFFVQAANE